MFELTLNTLVTGIIGLILGGAVTFLKAKYKGQKDMTKCTNERLDKQDKIIFLILKKGIMDSYNKYKTKKKIPDYEMELVDELYREYSEVEPNGMMLKRIEQMRSWTISEDDKG